MNLIISILSLKPFHLTYRWTVPSQFVLPFPAAFSSQSTDWKIDCTSLSTFYTVELAGCSVIPSTNIAYDLKYFTVYYLNLHEKDHT